MILDHMMENGVALSIVSDSNMIRVVFTHRDRQKRHAVPYFNHIHGLLLQFLAVSDANSK